MMIGVMFAVVGIQLEVRMRSLIFGMLVSMTLFGSVEEALSQSVLDPLASLNGRWAAEINIKEYGQTKACAEYWEEYKVSADGREITNSHPKGVGRGYRVLYVDGKSAVMYLNDEDRKYKNGDRWVWVLQMENPNLFYWRIFTFTLEQSEGPKYARARCPAS